GGGQRVFAGRKPHAIDIGVDDIDGGGVDRVLHVDDLVEVGAEEHAHIEDEQRRNGRHDARNGHVPDLLPAIGAVHFGGVVELGVDCEDGRQVEQAVPAGRAPDFGNHQYPADGAGIGHVIDR